MGDRRLVGKFAFTERELVAIMQMAAFIEAGGGIDGEPAQDRMARQRARDKAESALVWLGHLRRQDDEQHATELNR